jgi:hypothetical protein
MPCSLVDIYQCLRGTYCLHFQRRKMGHVRKRSQWQIWGQVMGKEWITGIDVIFFKCVTGIPYFTNTWFTNSCCSEMC